MRPDADTLSQIFFTHLNREEETLHDSLDVLTAVRHALLRGDVTELRALEDAQQRADAATAEVREERHHLRVLLAEALELPTRNISFSQLTAALPGIHRERLRCAGERLRFLIGRVEQLAQSNAALVRHFLGFSRRFLVDITGGDDTTGCYGRDGTHQDASFGPVFSTRG